MLGIKLVTNQCIVSPGSRDPQEQELESPQCMAGKPSVLAIQAVLEYARVIFSQWYSNQAGQELGLTGLQYTAYLVRLN